MPTDARSACPRRPWFLLAALWAAGGWRSAQGQAYLEAGDKFLIASFTKPPQIHYLRLSDPVWRPLVAEGLEVPRALCVDPVNMRLFVSDPEAQKVYWFRMEILAGFRLTALSKPRVAVDKVNAMGLAVDNIGSLYVAGHLLEPRDGHTAVRGIFRQDAVKLATSPTEGAPDEPIHVWSQSNTDLSGDGRSPQLYEPSSIGVDKFQLFWGNWLRGPETGAIVKSSLTIPVMNPLEKVKPLADNVPPHGMVTCMAVTTSSIFYGVRLGAGETPPAPGVALEDGSVNSSRACMQLAGEYTDSYPPHLDTPVVVSQTGCDVVAQWGPAMKFIGRIRDDVVQLDYEPWHNPSGKVSAGGVVWESGNFWTWKRAANVGVVASSSAAASDAALTGVPLNERGAVYGIAKTKVSSECGSRGQQCPKITSIETPTAMAWDLDATVYVASGGVPRGAVYSFASGSVSPHVLEKLIDAKGIFGLTIFDTPTGGDGASGGTSRLLESAALGFRPVAVCMAAVAAAVWSAASSSFAEV